MATGGAPGPGGKKDGEDESRSTFFNNFHEPHEGEVDESSGNPPFLVMKCGVFYEIVFVVFRL